ncbi:MAG: hypothetical protein U9R52_01495 [Candidatus Omnitrophota bacterium]|nr:hypothetical protein [Candidatus Omnitrophota bacterium]
MYLPIIYPVNAKSIVCNPKNFNVKISKSRPLTMPVSNASFLFVKSAKKTAVTIIKLGLTASMLKKPAKGICRKKTIRINK